MIDTVLNLEDFINILGSEGNNRNDVRICVEHKRQGSINLRCSVILSVGIYNLLTGRPKKILRCIVSRRTFNPFLLASEGSQERKEYESWLEETFKKVEEKLGFKPIEGYWSWSDDNYEG